MELGTFLALVLGVPFVLGMLWFIYKGEVKDNAVHKRTG
jgi:hypothetical protein